jgi:hypothetical protein
MIATPLASTVTVALSVSVGFAARNWSYVWPMASGPLAFPTLVVGQHEHRFELVADDDHLAWTAVGRSGLHPALSSFLYAKRQTKTTFRCHTLR